MKLLEGLFDSDKVCDGVRLEDPFFTFGVSQEEIAALSQINPPPKLSKWKYPKDSPDNESAIGLDKARKYVG